MILSKLRSPLASTTTIGTLLARRRHCVYSTMAPTETKGPRPIVISGPSGTGKSTILKRLFEAHPNKFGFSISHTTRQPRDGELHGREYFFTDPPSFLSLVSANGFIEHAKFGSNHYGTSFQSVADVAAAGKICVLDIEMEGVKQVAKSDLNARFLFLAPPSFEVLEQRLRGRGTDKEEDVQKRLEAARREMVFAESGEVRGKRVVNGDLEKAYKEVEEWVLGGEEEKI